LTEFETQLVTFLTQQYGLTGKLLTADRALQEFGIPAGEFTKAIENPNVRAALVERGIVFERFDESSWTSKSLTPIQLLVANSLLDLTDTRSQKKKLQDLETSTVTYQAWLKDPVFKEYLHKRAEQLIGENQHEVDSALLDRVRAGDLKAIAYYNELTGRFVQASRTQSGNVDIQSIIVKIIEIVDECVTLQEDKLKVGQKLKQLISARNMAGALVGDDDPIVVPEVVKMSSIAAPAIEAAKPKEIEL
jgi:hypothetical protein